MRSYLSVFLCIILNINAFTQNKIDKAEKAIADSSMVVFLNGQAEKYISQMPDSGIYFGELALKVGVRSHHYEYLNESHRIVGWCYYNQQNFSKAKFHLMYALNDSSLSSPEKNKIYEALLNASEKTKDYEQAFLFLKIITQSKDSINRQNQNETLLQLQNQLTETQRASQEKLQRKEKILEASKTRNEQLIIIGVVVVFVLVLLILLLLFLLERNKKKFNKSLEEKSFLITEINNQNQNLQFKIADYERLKSEIVKDKREGRIQEITIDKKKEEETTEKKEPTSIIDQYQLATGEKKTKLLPKLESFANTIPAQLQIIEQAFARHDWQIINSTLQNMKPIIHEAGLDKCELLITEINDHVNSNATNRAVVKLLSVKSTCIKTINAIKTILEKV